MKVIILHLRALNHLAAREKTQSARYVYTDAYIVCMLYNMIVSFHLCWWRLMERRCNNLPFIFFLS